MIKLGIFGKVFETDNTEELFQHASKSTVDCLHYNLTSGGLSEQPTHVPNQLISRLIKNIQSTGIDIVGISSTFNMIHPDPSVIDQGLRSMNVLAGLARQIGADFLSICTGTRDPNNKWNWHKDNSSAQSWSTLCNTLEKAIKIADNQHVNILIEPETTNVVSDAKRAKRLLDEMSSDCLRIVLDPANLFETAKEKNQIRKLVDESLELLGGHISMAHAKDKKLSGTPAAPGTGDIDFEHFVSSLKSIGFKGPLIMHGFSREDIPLSVKYLRSLL